MNALAPVLGLFFTLRLSVQHRPASFLWFGYDDGLSSCNGTLNLSDTCLFNNNGVLCVQGPVCAHTLGHTEGNFPCLYKVFLSCDKGSGRCLFELPALPRGTLRNRENEKKKETMNRTMKCPELRLEAPKTVGYRNWLWVKNFKEI